MKYLERDYDPYSQKFLSEDPIGFEGGDLNLYRYVGNRPLILNDPFGKKLDWLIAAAGGTLIAYLTYKLIVEPFYLGKPLFPEADAAEPEKPHKDKNKNSCDPKMQSCEPPNPQRNCPAGN